MADNRLPGGGSSEDKIMLSGRLVHGPGIKTFQEFGGRYEGIEHMRDDRADNRPAFLRVLEESLFPLTFQGSQTIVPNHDQGSSQPVTLQAHRENQPIAPKRRNPPTLKQGPTDQGVLHFSPVDQV